MKYALNLNEDGRVLSVTFAKYAPSAAVQVDELPEGNVANYLYENGQYVYNPIKLDITEYRPIKEQEISSACNQAIISGMSVETTQGLEHFSLEETDQINLTTATNAIQQGLTEYPYHADGQLCRMFTADEILAIADAATKHKLYHTTLCNHLLTWVRRAETKEELDSITYSEEALPEDLAANMVFILSLSSL